MTKRSIQEQANTLFFFGKKIREYMLSIHVDAYNLAEEKITHELSFPQMQMIMHIKNQPDCTISKLAEILDVSTPSVSAMVDKLVKKGALVRERSEKDRRVVVVKLSPTSLEHTMQMEAEMMKKMTNLIDKIGPELAESWLTVMQRVVEVLKEEEDEKK